MSDKGKPRDFVPRAPAAPSPWDNSVEFQLPGKEKKQEQPGDSSCTSELSGSARGPEEQEAGKADAVVDAAAFDTAQDAITRQIAVMRPEVRSKKLKPVQRSKPEPTAPPAPSEVKTATLRSPVAPVPIVNTSEVAQPAESQIQIDRNAVNTPAIKTAPKSHTFLNGMAILAMLVLFQCFALPRLTAGGNLIPPWTLISQIGGITFHASLFFGLLLLVVALPMPYIARAATTLSIGIALLAVALTHIRMETLDFAFRGHPGMAFAWGGSPLVTILLTVGLWFPAALFWRSRYTDSKGSRIGVGVGAGIVLLLYLFLGAVGGNDGTPIATLVSTLSNKNSLSADTISAFLLLIPLGLVPLSALALLKHPRTGASALWGWLFVTSVGCVPLIQSLFVASYRGGDWKFALAPLKASLFLYAALLVITIGIGHSAGEIMRALKAPRPKQNRQATPT